MYRSKKHLFFDLDDTVTASRTPFDDEFYNFYNSLPHDIIIVSGAQVSQIRKQTRNLPFFALGQNGNQARGKSDELLWQNDLKEHHVEAIQTHIDELLKNHDLEVNNPDDLIEYRGAQVSYSLIGHNELLENKRACDPDKKLRLSLLEKVPFSHDEVEVKIGGTTCFDYFEKGKHKGYNVKKLIEHMGWNDDDAIYFGDALFPGGNDEAVIGVIDTFPVNNHEHTLEILKTHFT